MEPKAIPFFFKKKSEFVLKRRPRKQNTHQQTQYTNIIPFIRVQWQNMNVGLCDIHCRFQSIKWKQMHISYPIFNLSNLLITLTENKQQNGNPKNWKFLANNMFSNTEYPAKNSASKRWTEFIKILTAIMINRVEVKWDYKEDFNYSFEHIEFSRNDQAFQWFS